MGLRIGPSSQGVLTTLRTLQQNLAGLRQAQERQATGLRINRAGDDPAGLVISEVLRAQIGSLEQAVENTQFGTSFVNTAEAALQEVSGQLVDLRAQAIRALNTGGLPDEALQAVQERADQIVGAIDRIAATTRFGRENLLNGQQGFTLSGVPAAITNVQVQQVDLTNGPQQVTVTLSAAATRAQAAGAIAGGQPGATVRITGRLGSQTVDIPTGATVAQTEAAINGSRDFTGVFASGGQIFSSGVGSDRFVEIDEITGDLAGIAEGRTTGTDAVGTINGLQAAGNGDTLAVSGAQLRANVTFAEGTAPGTYTFNVVAGGATFQLGGEPNASDRIQIGVDSIDPSRLGQTSTIGALDSIVSGGANDLLTNPAGAVRVIDAAIDELGGLRSQLGSLVADIFEPNTRSLGIAIENLTASESEIRDADFALEIANAVRNQVLSQAGIRVLGQQNLLGRSILELLR